MPKQENHHHVQLTERGVQERSNRSRLGRNAVNWAPALQPSTKAHMYEDLPPPPPPSFSPLTPSPNR